MIIVSQDKKTIVNFNNILKIDCVNDEIIVFYKSDEVPGVEGTESIGFYGTEERAKGVLSEIVQKYSSYLQLNGGPAILQGQMDIQPNIFNIPKVYEMPEK